jgi:lipopolysaccharide cholinephosphotransferase
MYYLLDVFHKVSNKFDIRYWAGCGTVLGYRRHGGIIPWDDDIDIDVHPDHLSKLADAVVEDEFSIYGFSLCPIYFGYRVCPKTLPTFGSSVDNNTTRNVTYNWPFLDVFATEFFDKTDSGVCDHIRYKYPAARKWWPDYYLTQEESQVSQVFFGPENMTIEILVPGRVDEYLDRIYGDNYMEIAYQELDHANNRPIEKVVCKVMERGPGQAIRAELPRHPEALGPL